MPSDSVLENILCVVPLMTQSEKDLPWAQQGNGKVQNYGDQHCLEGARDETMAMDLMKQKLSREETNPQSSLAHSSVGGSPADEEP